MNKHKKKRKMNKDKYATKNEVYPYPFVLLMGCYSSNFPKRTYYKLRCVFCRKPGYLVTLRMYNDLDPFRCSKCCNRKQTFTNIEEEPFYYTLQEYDNYKWQIWLTKADEEELRIATTNYEQ